MYQKQITALLLACLVIVSFMCYQQAKKIDDMERDISHLDDRIDTFESKVNDLESEIEEIKPSVASLQEEMEEHFPRPQKSFAQQRQEYIEQIMRYNAKREEELQAGIKNTDKNKDLYRNWLQFIKNRYNIDIEIK